MNLKNKIISMISAVSMLATLCVATTVSAANDAGFKVEVGEVADGKVTVNYVVENIPAITEFQVDAVFDEDAIDASSPVVSYPMGGLTSNNVYDGHKLSVGAMGITAAVPADGIIATVTYTLNAGAQLPIDFTLEYVHIGDNDGNSYDYEDSDGDTLEVTTATVYANATVTAINADGTVYVGKSTNLTATVDGELGDREIVWTAENGTVVPDAQDSTKAVLVATAEGAVKVTATINNNGTDAAFTKTFTAETKAEPMNYLVSSTPVADNETTVTVKPDPDYEGDNENPDYIVVAQFYTADGTASSWVSVKGAALEEGEASYTFGAQNAARVSVTVYDAGTGAVVGQ